MNSKTKEDFKKFVKSQNSNMSKYMEKMILDELEKNAFKKKFANEIEAKCINTDKKLQTLKKSFVEEKTKSSSKKNWFSKFLVKK